MLTLETRKSNQVSVDQVATAEKIVKEQYIGCLFLMNADQTRYFYVLKDLSNNFLLFQNDYPKTLTEAYNMLLNYMIEQARGDQYGRESIAFVAQD